MAVDMSTRKSKKKKQPKKPKPKQEIITSVTTTPTTPKPTTTTTLPKPKPKPQPRTRADAYNILRRAGKGQEAARQRLDEIVGDPFASFSNKKGRKVKIPPGARF